MLQETSKEFRNFFLLSFTKELIKNSSSEIYELEELLKEKAKKEEEKREYPLTNKESKENFYKKMSLPLKLEFPKSKLNLKSLPVLRIPEPKIPERFKYLRPTPTKNQINLGKLNVLINDPRVEMIESGGTNENIIVTGRMGRKTTGITLNSSEIKQIIQRFSEAAKIPLHEGVFKIVVGRLILSAINSGIVDSKFIIRKMAPPLEIPRMI